MATLSCSPQSVNLSSSVLCVSSFPPPRTEEAFPLLPDSSCSISHLPSTSCLHPSSLSYSIQSFSPYWIIPSAWHTVELPILRAFYPSSFSDSCLSLLTFQARLAQLNGCCTSPLSSLQSKLYPLNSNISQQIVLSKGSNLCCQISQKLCFFLSCSSCQHSEWLTTLSSLKCCLLLASVIPCSLAIPC